MSKNWQNLNGSANSQDLKDKEFLNRIKKSLYYSKIPATDCLSLPVTELTAEFFTGIKNGRTLERLDVEEASRISRNTCTSPCTLVLALLYVERLKDCNPKYLQRVAPSELFLISLMVASKFLHDDGEDDEVITAEWAISGRLTMSRIIKLEKEFLDAIEWTVFVRQQDFWERLQRLEKDVAYREVQKREWCTYTELSCLMDHAQLLAIAHAVIHVSYICLATYIAGLITLYGSTLITQSIHMIFLSNTSIGTESARQLTRPNFSESIIQLHARSHEIDDELSTVVNSLIRHETGENADCSTAEVNNGADNWQWWLNSTLTWLPVYCGFKNNVTSEIKESTGKFSFNSTQVEIRRTINYFALENYRRYYANWKKVLGISLAQLKQHWIQRQTRHEIVTRLPISQIC